jgi:hypothetical protein
MTSHDFTRIVMWLIVLSPLLVALAYLIVRAASWAYFRTKLEHFRTTMKELKGGTDGEE